MKQFHTCSLFSSFILAVASQSLVAQTSIPYLASGFTVDGVVESVWSGVPSYPVNKQVSGFEVPLGAADLSASWRAAYNQYNLYILMEVTDDVVAKYNGDYTSGGVQWWIDDSVEIYIDGDGSGGTTYDKLNDIQLGVRPADPSGVFFFGANSVKDITGIVVETALTSTGYTVEVSIPWPSLRLIVLAGDPIGLDAAANDGDINSGANPSARLAVNDTTGTAFGNPSVLKGFILGAGTWPPVDPLPDPDPDPTPDGGEAIVHTSLPIARDVGWLGVDGQGYFVAPSGSDNNPGTQSAPFATIGKAASLAVAGDTVWIAPGTYREMVRPANTGSESAPIVFRGYGTGRAVVTGLNTITGWTQVGGSEVWEAAWPGGSDGGVYQSDQVFANREMLNLLRWPKETAGNLTRAKEASIDSVSFDSANKKTFIIEAEFAEPDGRWAGAQAWINLSNKGWDGQGQTGSVFSTSQGGKQVVLLNTDTRAADGRTEGAWIVGVGTNYYLFNPTPAGLAATGGVEAALGRGEWWVNSQTQKIYVRLKDGSSPAGQLLETRRRRFGFDLSNRSNIVLADLALFAASVTTDDQQRRTSGVAASTDVLLDNLEVDFVTHFTDQTGDYQGQWQNVSGLIISGDRHTVRNCTFNWSAASAISVFGRENRIYNNRIRNAGYSITEAGALNTGVNTTSVDHKIGYNTLNESAGLGISMRGIRNSDPAQIGMARLHHNHIYSMMLRVGDGAAMDWVGIDGQWIRVDHNLIHDIPGFLQFGIYPDYGGAGGRMRYQIDHNVVFNVWAPIGGNGFTDIVIENNVALSSGSVSFDPGGIHTGNGTKENIGVELRNNISSGNLSGLNNALKQSNLTGTRATLANLFVDGTNADSLLRDYHLKPGSTTAIDKGVVTPRFGDPVAGSVPDIGAHELGLDGWVAGFDAVPWYLDDDDSLRIGAQGATTRGTARLNPFGGYTGPLTFSVGAASSGLHVTLAPGAWYADEDVPVQVQVDQATAIGSAWFTLVGTAADNSTHTQDFSIEIIAPQAVARIEMSPSLPGIAYLLPGSTTVFSATAFDANDLPLVVQPDFQWSVDGNPLASGTYVASYVQGGPYTLTASAGGKTASQTIRVALDWVNGIALTASSSRTSSTGPEKANDGDSNTQWVSNFSDPQYLIMDLGEAVQVTDLQIEWHGNNYGRSYGLDASRDGVQWERVYTVANNPAGGYVEHTGLDGVGRWFRLAGLTRSNNASGYVVKEISLLGLSQLDSLGDLVDESNGWRTGWLDWLYDTAPGQQPRWIYRIDSGWLYAAGPGLHQRIDTAWFYDPASGGWCWTIPGVYPWRYDLSSESWQLP